MIEGFEDITYDLTEGEKKLVPSFVTSFSKYRGKNNAVTSKQIIAGFEKKGIKISGSRVRLIISYIRDAWLVPGLIASSKGYYITEDVEDMKRWCDSMSQREAKIGNLRRKGEEYLQQQLSKLNGHKHV